MIFINGLLFNTPYQSQIEPIYLEALKSTNDYIRRLALNGLRFSKKKRFINILKEHLKVSSSDVESTITRFLESPDPLQRNITSKPVELSERDVFKLLNPSIEEENTIANLYIRIVDFFKG